MSLPCVFEARRSGHHHWGALRMLVPARKNPDSTGLGDPDPMKCVSMKDTCWAISTPTQASPGTQVQGWDKSPYLRGNKAGITFLSFP